MKKLSIIIPVLNEQECIVARLTALQALREKDCELVLVDGGSTDHTAELAKPFVDKLVASEPGRAVQMNRGAENAEGKLFLFLHIDTVLPDSGEIHLAKSIAEQSEAWGWFRLQFDNRSTAFKIISASMNTRAAFTKVSTGDQTLFITRELFNRVGGFPALPLMEDIAMSKLLRHLCRPKIIAEKVTTSARRWEQHGIMKTIFFMWWLRLLYFFGVSPASLASKYYPNSDANSVHSIPELEAEQVVETPFRYPRTRILLFAKAPVQGQVKTRLEPILGSKSSLELHRAMSRRIAQLLSTSRLAPWQLWVSADISNEFFLSLCNKKNIYIQNGADLGARMANSLENSLAESGVEGALILGADCPAYDESYLDSALRKLEEGNDVVLGPAEDGGYVLIGMTRPHPALFQGVEWGSDRVLQQTIANIKQAKLTFSLLEPLWDVDRPNDLSKLADLDPPLSWESA